MGFLKKLFEKKDCEICGGEIGLLGNTKLADGDMCKDCKAKLSPLFRVEKETTVSDIVQQIAYREENKKALEDFRPDEEFGNSEKLFVDTAAKKFAFAANGDWQETESDILDFSQVTRVETDIEEYTDSTSESHDEDEEYDEIDENETVDVPVSNFHVVLHVDSPYFDTIFIFLSDGDDPSDIGDDSQIAKYRKYEQQMNRIRELFGA